MNDPRFFYTQEQVDAESETTRVRAFWGGFVLGAICLGLLEFILVISF